MTSASRCVPGLTAASLPCRSDVKVLNDLCRGPERRQQINNAALGLRLPGAREYVEAGGRRAAAVPRAQAFSDQHRRAAEFGDKILRSVRPAELRADTQR
jgi:hypothetical protein